MHDATSLLKAVLDGASVPAVGLDLAALRVFAANDAFARLVGRERSALVGVPCYEVFHGADGPCTPELRSDGCPARLAIAGGAESVRLQLSRLHAGPAEADFSAITVDDHLLLLALPGPMPPPPAGTDVVVRALGPLDVHSADGQPLRTRRPQALDLLKVLLVERGHALPAPELVRRLWPHGAPGSANAALRVLVHDLRFALEPQRAAGAGSRFVVARAGSYLIPENAPLQLDSDEFESLAAEVTAALAAGRTDDAWVASRRALDLYGGDLFEDDPPAPWLLPRRRRLRATWIATLLASSAIAAQRAHFAIAIRDAARAVRADLANEAAQRQLILMHALDQGRAASLEVFVRLFQEFKQRFSIAPSRETAAMVERLTGAEPLEALLRDYCPLALPPAAASTHR